MKVVGIHNQQCKDIWIEYYAVNIIVKLVITNLTILISLCTLVCTSCSYIVLHCGEATFRKALSLMALFSSVLNVQND